MNLRWKSMKNAETVRTENPAKAEQVASRETFGTIEIIFDMISC